MNSNKGPHSLGRKNGNNISIQYRGLHPSYIGRIDLLVCGNSDPGTSGVLSPFSKVNGLYFDDSEEPNDFQFDFKKSIEKLMEDENTEYLKIETDNKEDYYKILDELVEFNKNAFKITSTSREDDLSIEVENLNEKS